MKDPIDKLREQYESQKRLEEEKAAQIKDLEAALSVLRSEQEKYAEAGDFDGFEQKAVEIRKLEGRIYVATKSAKNIQKVTPETIRDAWKEYASGYSKSAEKRYAEYLKHAADICTEYEDCVKGQNMALKVQEELISMGADPVELTLDWFLPYSVPPMGYPHNHGIDSPEYEFFTLHNFWRWNTGVSWENKDRNIMNTVVRNHKPVDDCDFEH